MKRRAVRGRRGDPAGRIAEAGLLLLAASWGFAADATCRAVGATYAPRSVQASPDIRYRMTIVPTPPDMAVVAERYRFDLFSRRTGRRLSSIVLDNVCGMGRAPCATWQPGKDDEGFFHSTVIRLEGDFSPARDWSAAHAIVFPGFGESDWATPLARHRYPNVRYYGRPHVQPDLSGQSVWVRTACGPVAAIGSAVSSRHDRPIPRGD